MQLAMLATESAYDPDALSLGLLVLRVATGVTLAAHGYGKFFRGGRIAGTARWFDSMGMRPGKVHALSRRRPRSGPGSSSRSACSPHSRRWPSWR
ncbi:MAG: DoxX family protein [Acidimicrobiales bacterium]